MNYEVLLEQILTWLGSMGLKILAAGAVILVGMWVIKLLCKSIRKILERSSLDGSVVGFIVSIARVVLWIIVIFAALGQIINISSMVAALGAAGLTASFALQGSLSNFVSGMQVIFSKPFTEGDYLLVDGAEGTVKKLDVLNTTLLSIDNKEIIIPNSKITSSIVINYSSQDKRRLDLSYSVSYDTDLKLPKRILRDLISNDERFIHEPEPIVAVGAHEDSSIQIVAKAWVKTADYWPTYWDMQEKVKEEFDKNGVVIPFPQLDVHTNK